MTELGKRLTRVVGSGQGRTTLALCMTSTAVAMISPLHEQILPLRGVPEDQEEDQDESQKKASVHYV